MEDKRQHVLVLAPAVEVVGGFSTGVNKVLIHRQGQDGLIFTITPVPAIFFIISKVEKLGEPKISMLIG